MLQIHHKLILIVALLFAPSAFAQSTETPNGTVTSANNTCDGTPVADVQVAEDPDTPGGDWCVANSNNVNPTWLLNFTDPSITLDTATDAQEIAVYVGQFDTGQGGDPDIRIDIYDGVACVDLHKTGAVQSLLTGGELMTETWTAAGISGKNDICVDVVCIKAGGSGANRNSCNLDAVEWRAAEAAGGVRRILTTRVDIRNLP